MWSTQYAVRAKSFVALLLYSAAAVCFDSPAYPTDSSPTENAKVSHRLRSATTHDRLKVWVVFNDKGISTEDRLQTALDAYESEMSVCSKRRRTRRTDLPFPDISDIPVPSPYITAVLNVGGRLRGKSRWLNAISLEATSAEIDDIAQLPFVRAIDPIEVYKSTSRRSDSSWGSASQEAPPGLAPLNYGDSRVQIEQIQANFLHESGFFGEGMVIGLLDTGFNLDHTALQRIDVMGQYDFVND